jgi:hypothetical protein
MPTRYRRVAVVLDPELSDALRLAAERLEASSQAEGLRELALIGARSLRAGEAEPERARRALDELGATRERGDLRVISRRLRRRYDSARRHAGAPETASESLEWVRGPR